MAAAEGDAVWLVLLVDLAFDVCVAEEEAFAVEVVVYVREGCAEVLTAEGWVDAVPFCMAEWARKAARKFPKKGLWVVMVEKRRRECGLSAWEEVVWFF